ncbi:gamma-butyrobetaine hydroxylase-like domain-containing protein [Marinibaculum pumilum]|uniref:Gamma-butyrobetaine hydroxylase-like domain-containing protein n=1 Tax=Marinibaculum pumilum TaxID=1766165 RepID=A0ABV7KV21_9PROT
MSDSAHERAGRPAPEEIRLSKDGGTLTVSFPDASFAFTPEFLRVESPSAEVRGHSPSQRSYVGGKRDVRITAIEPVGSYAVRLRFDDGHDSGIYSWAWFYDMGSDREAVWAAYLKGLASVGGRREP